MGCNESATEDDPYLSNNSGLPTPKQIKNSSNALTINTKNFPKYIDFNLTSKKINLSDLFEVIKIIPLSDKVIIGKIDKVFYDDKKIFVLDRRSSKAIHVFDYEGNFLYSINNSGKGPGEFNMLRDACLDRKSKEILLLDNYKILRFDYDGQFINQAIIPIAPHSIAVSPGSHYILLNLNYNAIPSPKLCYNLFAFSNKEKPKLRSNNFPFPFEYTAIDYSLINYFFESSDHSVNYISVFNDTIFNIQSNEITPRFSIQYEGYGVPIKEKNRLEFNPLNEKIWGPLEVLESESELMILSVSGKGAFITIYNKEDRTSLTYEAVNFNDDTFSHISFFPSGIAENAFIFQLEPGHIHELAIQGKEVEFQEIKERLNELTEKQRIVNMLDKTNIDSNPVLILLTVKDHIYD